jgi:hypothetical protein
MTTEQASTLVNDWLRKSLRHLENNRALGFDDIDARLLGNVDPAIEANIRSLQPRIAQLSADMCRKSLMSNDLSQDQDLALSLAQGSGFEIAAGSPDAAILTRMAALAGWQEVGHRLCETSRRH